VAEIPVAKVLAALERKGFRRSDTHHILLRFYLGGRLTSIKTRISHGQRSLDDWFIGQMTKQIRLSKKEFLDLTECSLSEAEYGRLMVARGHIRP
jgi:hypothetical protein